MLPHFSVKFTQPSNTQLLEPRATIFLNRFTRTSSIIYATDSIEDVIGIPASIMYGRSFYYCIAESCLPNAVKCLEGVKANDSIAYLRFWFRDPCTDDPAPATESDSDEAITAIMSEDIERGDLQLKNRARTLHDNKMDVARIASNVTTYLYGGSQSPRSRTPSGDIGSGENTQEAVFGASRGTRSLVSCMSPSPQIRSSTSSCPAGTAFELEAVVSCTSDNLIVFLRKARFVISHPVNHPAKSIYDKGLSTPSLTREPVLFLFHSQQGAGFATGFAPSHSLMITPYNSASPPRTILSIPELNESMGAPRDQAVFASALTGISGVTKGKPYDSSMPKDGCSIGPNGTPKHSAVDERYSQGNGMYPSQERRMASKAFGDPGLGNTTSGGGKRVMMSL
jgi:hypothetical protein